MKFREFLEESLDEAFPFLDITNSEHSDDDDRLADELLTDRDYWEAKLTNLVYSLATEEEVGEWSSMNDIADNLIEHIGWKMQKLELAEAAVARVRELALESQAEVAQMNMPNIRTLSGEILRALDGEPNE